MKLGKRRCVCAFMIPVPRFALDRAPPIVGEIYRESVTAI
jgi:hypothetical protein